MKSKLLLSILTASLCSVSLSEPINSCLGGEAEWEQREYLPYDSEVEYLEFTGTQTVDLGFSLEGSSNFKFLVTAQYIDNGNLPDDYQGRIFSNENQPYKYTDIYTYYGTYIMFRPARFIVSQKWQKNTYEYNGVEYIVSDEHKNVILRREYTFPVSDNPCTLFLGCRRNALTSKQCRFVGRIYEAQFEVDGFSMWLKPVRIEDKGFFYDVVSGEFLKGSGTLIPGPDVESE